MGAGAGSSGCVLRIDFGSAAFAPASARRCIMATQASLKELWLASKGGGLPAREQMKAWALREAWKEVHDAGGGRLGK